MTGIGAGIILFQIFYKANNYIQNLMLRIIRDKTLENI